MNTVYPHKSSCSFLASALKDTVAVAFGYIPLGIAFGFIFQKTGADWYFAPLMSIFVFAGAAQFIAATVMLHGGSLASIALATFLVNLRHIFYGISFVGKFPKNLLAKFYMIFGLTDESYSILTSVKRPYHNNYAFSVIIISHGYWIIGSLLGAYLATLITKNLYFLQFALTSLFLVMLIEQILLVKRAFPFVIAAAAIAIASVFSKQTFLFVAIFLSVAGLMLEYWLGGIKNV